MKVFLSYSQADRVVARELATRITEAGHEVWFADDEIYPGDNVARKAGQALDKARAMVVLISPAAMKSINVMQEVQFALGACQYRGRLIPVIIKATPDMPWILKKFPVVRLGKDLDEACREIADYIEHGFELTPA